MAQRILALEVADEAVRAALAERAWSTFTLLATYQVERREEEPDAGPALRRLLEETGTPDSVISAFPGELVAKRILTLPFRDKRRLEQAVPFALEEHLPFGIEDSVVAYLPLTREKPGATLMAAMVRREDLQAHLDLLAQVGLDPKTVTLSSLALSAVINRARNGSAEVHPRLLVELEDHRTSVALIDERGVPRALRVIPMGMSSANGHGRNGPASSIVAAVRQTLLAQASEAPPADVVISGPAASSAELRDNLAQELDLPQCTFEQLALPKFLDPTHTDNDTLRLLSCVAMLMSELPAAPIPVLNFRRGEFVFRGRTGDLAPLYTSAKLGLVLVGCFLLQLLLGISTNLHHLHLLDRQVVTAAAPAIAGVPGARVRDALSSQILATRKRIRMLGGSLGATSPLELLLGLSQKLPQGPIDIDSFTIDDQGLRIAGKAASFAAIAELKRSLTAVAGIADVQVVDERPDADRKVEFHISAQFSETNPEVEARSR